MVRQCYAKSRGFTLVELLVAVAVLGVLVAAIVALTSGFLGFSRRVSVINDRLTDLNDAMGYVALNARRAMDVIGDGSTVTIEPADELSFDCAVTADCIALVLPVTEEDGSISGYDLHAYRVVPLSGWTGNPGVQGGWAGTDTPVLLEYAAALCTNCGLPSADGDTIDATQIQRISLVISDLFLEEGEPSQAFAPFTIDQEGRRITISLRTRGSGVEDGVLVPASGRLSLQAVRRP